MCTVRQRVKASLVSWGLPFAVILPTMGRAEWFYSTNNGTITIRRYIGTDRTLVIPESIGGLPVTGIGLRAFLGAKTLTRIVIPETITQIDGSAFGGCSSLTSVNLPRNVTTIAGTTFSGCTALPGITIPDGVTSIGHYAFLRCTSLTSITIPDSVTTIDKWAFEDCAGLTSVVIGNGVTSIEDWAFSGCTSLISVYFRGNAPSLGGGGTFRDSNAVTIYYLPGVTGWGPTFGGRPTALWVLPKPVILTAGPNFGVQPNGFGFRISWATNASVVVEAATSLPGQTWSPVYTNTLTGGWSDFRDPQWTDYPARFYRLQSP